MRILEKVLEREFDPNRRLHGYARPGMDMDREDFIDLASVSKQVPGKTPAQVTIPNATFRWCYAYIAHVSYTETRKQYSRQVKDT